MKFDSYRYIFPPRPKNAINPNDLNKWDNGSLLAQVKLNGSNCVIFTDGIKVISMNRHGQRMSNFKISDSEILSLFRGQKGKWIVLNGEYMNKGRVDETGKICNDKLFIFDILVNSSEYLVGHTFQERYDILENFYKSDQDHLYYNSISENIKLVNSFHSDYKSLFDDSTKIDMVEGVVLKRKSAKLEIGNTENNNTKSQLKSRKATKNYKY